MRIRPFRESDREALAGLLKAEHPETLIFLAEIPCVNQNREAQRPPNCWIVEAEGQVIGAGICYQEDPESREFWLRFIFPPSKNPALFVMLYRKMVDVISAFHPCTLRVAVLHNRTDDLTFLQNEGFTILDQHWKMVLDVEEFDPEPFGDHETRVAAQGVKIRTLEEQMSRDPTWLETVYRLHIAITRDIPSVDPPPLLPFETFRRRMMDEPPEDLLRDGWFIAIKGKTTYIGYHTLWKTRNPGALFIGTTGVLRSFRRKGIALALKLQGIHYAKDRGVRYLITQNNVRNEAILALNRKLGFHPRERWVILGKAL